MSKKLRRVLFFTGLAIVMVSLAFFVYSYFSISNNKNGAADIVSKLNTLIPETTKGYPTEKSDTTMPVIELDGVDYIGTISIPISNTTLPVCNKWSSTDVSKYPHRFCGSVYNGTLVIGGSDNPGQFDFMKLISAGDLVYITDTTGAVFTYSVNNIVTTEDVSFEALNNTGAELTLFSRNTYALDYTVVMCELK